MLAVLTIAIACLLPACAEDDPPPPPDAFPTFVPEPSSSPPPPPATDVQAYYDASQEAYDKFIATWRYETLVQGDLERGEDLAYQNGVGACARMVAGWTIEDTIHDIKTRSGFTATGAEAVFAAAIRTLCTRYNEGYLTTFDRQVSQIRDALQRETGTRPPEIETGETAKLVCDYIGDRGNPEGLSDLMASEGTPGGAPVKPTVRAVVAGHCAAYQPRLGPYWYSP